MKTKITIIALILSTAAMAQWSKVGNGLDSNEVVSFFYKHQNGKLFYTSTTNNIGKVKIWDGNGHSQFGTNHVGQATGISVLGANILVGSSNSLYEVSPTTWNPIGGKNINTFNLVELNGKTYYTSYKSDSSLMCGSNKSNLSVVPNIIGDGFITIYKDTSSIFVTRKFTYNLNPTYLAEFDGTNWKTYPYPSVADSISGSSNRALRFKGDLYVSASIGSTGKLYKWNGSKWSTVWTGKYPYESVELMVVFDNSLYFMSAVNINASSTTTSTMFKLSENIVSTVVQMSGNVMDMVAYNNELYIGGKFNNVDGNKIYNLAKFKPTSTGIHENVDKKLDAVIYPNPTSGQFTVDAGMGEAVVIIYNSIGQVILNQPINGKQQLDLNASPGVYFVQVAKDGKISTPVKLINQ